MQATHSAARQQRPRSLHLIPLDGALALVIRQGAAVTGYWLTELAGDSRARGFEFAAAPSERDERYHVEVTGTRAASCDCRDYGRSGRCEHADAILELIGRGELPRAGLAGQVRESAAAGAA